MSNTNPTIDELRAEFRRNDVRGWIWSWLQNQLLRYSSTHIRGRLKPRVYSPSGAWDSTGLNDLLNGFIVERGIQKGAIAKALLAADDTASAIAYLNESFKHFVISERPRSLTRNIFDRLRDVLDQQVDFLRLGGVPPHSYYGLADWEDDPPPAATEEHLRDASRYLPPDIRWVNYDSGTRQSPGISSEDLERIVRSLLTGIGGLLSARQIMGILEERYPLRDELSDASSDQLDRTPGTFSDPLEVVEASDIARRALAAFTQRQRSIVQLMLEDPSMISVRDVADRLDISKSTASNELRSIQGKFRLLGASNDVLQRQILDALGPLLKAS
jgi:DNA-binding CsgD family transcriptional regulator